MAKKPDQIIEPLNASLDEVADSVLISSKTLRSKSGGILRATHKGNFKEKFGFDVDCYVLNDEHKTAVISQTGMGQAIGLSSRGNAFPRFAASKAMENYLGAEEQKKIAKPFKFQYGSGGAGLPPIDVNGYDVTLLCAQFYFSI